jgi:hypothetical protein
MRISLKRSGAIALPFVIFGLGTWLLAWPAWRDASGLFAESEALERRVASFTGQAKALESLALRVAESRNRESRQTKRIPPTPNMVDLMRTLSCEVDGKTVIDQTITAGKPMPAVVGETFPLEAMPLTIDMRAKFGRIFGVVQNAERMSRLVRIASLRLWRPTEDRESEGADPLDEEIIVATLGLEAIYECEPAPVKEASK